MLLYPKKHCINWTLLLDIAQKYDHIYKIRVGLNILKEYVKIPDLILTRINLLEINEKQAIYINNLQSAVYNSNKNNVNNTTLKYKILTKWNNIKILYYQRLAFRRLSRLEDFKDSIIFVGYFIYRVIRKIKRVLVRSISMW